MEVKEIKSKSRWEEFLVEIKNKTFLQSWNWGEFQKSRGRPLWRLGVFEEGELIGSALVEKIEAKRGVFLLVPHGPNCQSRDKDLRARVFKVLLRNLEKIGKEEGASFIRFSPIWERTEENEAVFKKEDCRGAPIHIHPEASWVLDITPSQKELLMDMRKSTRYNVRKSLKDEKIKVYKGDEKELELFSKLHKKTAERHDFVPFSRDYLKKELDSFRPDKEMELYTATHSGEIGAMAFVVFWSGIGFYHHAVLKKGMREYPLSYRILWEAIIEAKKRGATLFDFWGYAPPQSDHPWAGPTLFKMGFGGFKKEYVKTQDFVLSPFYWLDYIVETIRRKRRGFDG